MSVQFPGASNRINIALEQQTSLSKEKRISEAQSTNLLPEWDFRGRTPCCTTSHTEVYVW